MNATIASNPNTIKPIKYPLLSELIAWHNKTRHATQSFWQKLKLIFRAYRN